MFIRKAVLTDVTKLAELHVLAWRAAYAGLMSENYLASMGIDKRTSDWQHWINTPGPGTIIVVEELNEIKGFCVFGPTRDNDLVFDKVGEILALNIHPNFWRCGYGKFLCESVLSEGKLRKWESLTLWTLKSNELAKQFYESLGFKQDGIERVNTIEECHSEKIEEVRYCTILQSISLPSR